MAAGRGFDGKTVAQGLLLVGVVVVVTFAIGLTAWPALNPGILLLLPIVFVSLRAGMREAVVVGALAFAIDAFWLHTYGAAPDSWGAFDLYRLAVFCVAAATAVVLPAHLREQAQRLERSRESLRRAELERNLFHARSRLAEQEKLASLGALVNGVAHEMRTPLTGILNRLHLVERRLAEVPAGQRERLAELHRDIALDAERLQRLVDQLRAHSRVPLAPRALRLNDAVEDAVRLYSLSTPERVPVDLRLGAQGNVHADPLAIQQIVVHLLRNAADATPASGVIRVRTLDTPDGPAFAVQDEGNGIPQDVEARMFDEFYTTKAGRSGLDLSIVRRYAEAQRGAIAWTTGPGGTTFTVTFPAAPQATQSPLARK